MTPPAVPPSSDGSTARPGERPGGPERAAPDLPHLGAELVPTAPRAPRLPASTAAAEALAPELEHASTEKLSHSAFLARLLGVEVASTEERRLAGRRRFACLPAPWHLGDFDFEAQPRLDRKLIDELATLRFVEEAANVLFIGPPGVGKTQLAIGLGSPRPRPATASTTRGRRPVAQTLQAAHLEGLAHLKLRAYTQPSLLVIDKLGYLPLDQNSANWIFQVVSRRYDRGSVILTSNRGFSDWGQVFADAVVAGAIVDRLLHDATVLNIRGHSYRMRAYVDQQKLRGGGAMVG